MNPKVCGLHFLVPNEATPLSQRSRLCGMRRSDPPTHGDLLACYKKPVAVNPNAHGFITVDVLIEADGKVAQVETTGGAVLGEGTMACMSIAVSAQPSTPFTAEEPNTFACRSASAA